MLEWLIAFGAERGIDDAGMLQLIGAGLAFTVAALGYAESRWGVGGKALKRLRKLNRVWKRRFPPPVNHHTPKPSKKANGEYNEQPEDDDDYTRGAF